MFIKKFNHWVIFGMVVCLAVVVGVLFISKDNKLQAQQFYTIQAVEVLPWDHDEIVGPAFGAIVAISFPDGGVQGETGPDGIFRLEREEALPWKAIAYDGNGWIYVREDSPQYFSGPGITAVIRFYWGNWM